MLLAILVTATSEMSFRLSLVDYI